MPTLALKLVPRPMSVCWLLALVATVACGGNEFTAGGSGGTGGGAGGGKASGGDANGGSAGKGSGGGGSGGSAQGGSAGAASGGSSGGGSGGSTTTCACASGQYCQVTTSTCRDCSDLSRLSFATPEKIATISSSTAGQQRFPRVGSAETELFYRAGPAGDEKIWETPDYTAGYGTVVSGAGEIDSGCLFLGIGQEPNLLFDRNEGNVRRIWSANWDGTLNDVTLAPAPLNSDAGMMPSDFSVAVAVSPGGGDVARAFWMTSRLAPGVRFDLVTAELGADVVPEEVRFTIESPGGTQCGRSGADATPWVTRNGDLMLFRNFPVDENCGPSDGDATDLFATILDPATGQPPPGAVAIPLTDVNHGNNSTETDPSLSPDLCALYFASDSGQGVFEFDVFRSVRH